jgi:hypothetical protein
MGQLPDRDEAAVTTHCRGQANGMGALIGDKISTHSLRWRRPIKSQLPCKAGATACSTACCRIVPHTASEPMVTAVLHELRQ